MPNNIQYGLPYIGSKNKIATKIIDVLPAATHLYDVFAGGCAITHAAMLSGKYEHIHINDIYGGITQLFIDAINGKYANESRWISRETFHALRNTDAYISICWSFGNDQMNYMYNKNIETWKRAYWEAVVHGDFSVFAEIGIHIPKQYRTKEEVRNYIKANNEQCKQTYIRYLKENNKPFPDTFDKVESLERLGRLQSLERLGRLQSLERLGRLQSLERSVLSYEQLQIEPDSVIYCDPPYNNKRGYICGLFNSEVFYDWCMAQKAPVYISEYNMPENRFRVVAEYNKTCTIQRRGAFKVKERLYTPIR